MYPVTGHTYPEVKLCIRCFHENTSQLYQLCQSCRDHDEEMLRDERKELFSDDMDLDGYESPFEIRASLGI